MFMGLLIIIVNASNHTKCVSLSNLRFITQSTLINLHPHEYSQKFHCHPFATKLDRCVGNCKTLNDLCNKVCVPNKQKDLNISLFIVIIWISESRTLTKHVSCECEYRFDGRKCNSDQ